MGAFARLDLVWQAALRAGIDAYLRSEAAPIGAVLTNAAGEIVSVAANDADSSLLAHAEMRALNGLARSAEDTGLALSTTLEPCPMCVGAIRLARLAGIRYAARDPAAGAIDLLRANAFMRELRCDVVGPGDEVMEGVMVALLTESRQRRGQLRWRAEWLAYHPRGVQLGIELAERGARAGWVRGSASPEEVFDITAALLDLR